jgi:hypothetical protein
VLCYRAHPPRMDPLHGKSSRKVSSSCASGAICNHFVVVIAGTIGTSSALSTNGNSPRSSFDSQHKKREGRPFSSLRTPKQGVALARWLLADVLHSPCRGGGLCAAASCLYLCVVVHEATSCAAPPAPPPPGRPCAPY